MEIIRSVEEKVLSVAAKVLEVIAREVSYKDFEMILKKELDGLGCDLLKDSNIPDRGQRELRELVRCSKSPIGERTRKVNRMQKVLEGCNIKLSSVVTDITGASAKAMLKAIIDGVVDTAVVARLAKGKMKNKQKSWRRPWLAMAEYLPPGCRGLLNHG